jgi:hypothetical protein
VPCTFSYNPPVPISSVPNLIFTIPKKWLHALGKARPHRRSLMIFDKNHFSLYCQNPNSTKNSIELNLRLDYILSARSTTHPTTQTICCCCAAQLAGRDLCVQLYSYRPVQALCTKIDKTNVPLYYDRLDKCSTVL